VNGKWEMVNRKDQKSFFIFHLPFLFPSLAGRGARGEGAKLRKEKLERYVFVLTKPSPNPLPKGEGVKIREWQMENDKWKMFSLHILHRLHSLRGRHHSALKLVTNEANAVVNLIRL